MGSDRTATENPLDPGNPGFLPNPPGYHLLKKLDEGGMGQVYRAQDLDTGQFVAIKFALQSAKAERFRREYKELAKLDHPNILKVYKFDAQATPPYMVMEWLLGETLSKFIRNLGSKRLPLHIGIPLFLKLTEALIYLHRHGITHRDLKPSNLMVVSSRGVPDLKVMDFGIVHVENASRPLTNKGQFLGTVKYCAPEQLLDASTIGPPADLYSLGLILYEVFTGQFPFKADTTAEMREQHLRVTPPPASTIFPDLPPALDKLIAALLQKDPKGRPANAETVQFVLNSITVTYPLAGRQTIQSAAQIRRGSILNHRYRVEQELGRGGYGTVYLADDLVQQQEVAVKVNPDVSPEAARQFQREARILAGLSHPSLPRVRAYFIETDMQCLVMDYIRGSNLADVLQHAVKQLGRPIPEKDLLVWADQVCEALQYLHRQDPPVIHRDIKPENIIIGRDNRAYLADFGLAKINPATKTSTAAIGITPGYAPPEQYGQTADYTDVRSDIYALGATLYHLLTGVKPPESVSVQMGNQPPAPSPRQINPEISPEVNNAICRAMQIKPEGRFASIAAFRATLHGQSQLPPTPTRPTIRKSKNRRWAAVGIGASLAFSCISMAAILWRLLPITIPTPSGEYAILTAQARRTETAIEFLALSISPTFTDTETPTSTEIPTITYTPTITLTETPTPTGTYVTDTPSVTSTPSRTPIFTPSQMLPTWTSTSIPCYILITSASNGNISPLPEPNCQGNKYLAGTDVTLVAQPAPGYSFSGWSGDCSSTGNCVVTMDSNKSVTASFVAVSTNCYAVSLGASPTGAGNVNITTVQNCTGGYKSGTTIKVTQSPNSGYIFANWSGACNGSGSCSFIMSNKNENVTANYAATCYNLSLIHTGSGNDPAASPTNSSGCSAGQYHSGESISLTASPAAGYQVSSWSGTNNDGSTSATNSLTMPASAKTVTVNYAQLWPMTIPVFEYPANNQTLSYENAYMFKVQPISYAEGFLWGFSQNGVLVWENLRDTGRLDGNIYNILQGDPAHSKFQQGNVDVIVRAKINGQWTAATIIAIKLVTSIPTPDPPQLVSPANGLSSQSTSITLSWSSAVNATEYYLDYSGTTNGTSGWTTGTSFYASLAYGTYTWHVKARNASSEGSWSDTWSFTLVRPPNDIIINVNGSGFSSNLNYGGWAGIASRGIAITCSQNASQLMYTRANNSEYSWGRWTPNIPDAGQYTVFVYIPQYAHSMAVTSSAKYLISYSGGSTTVAVNQNSNLCGWINIGTYQFATGSNGNIYIENKTDDGVVTLLAADAIKFVWAP